MKESNEEHQIEALLRATGRRPAVPADRAARVKSAVEGRWQIEVERRSRRRKRTAAILALAATVTVAVALGVWQWSGPGDLGVGAAQVEIAIRDVPGIAAGDRVAAGSDLTTGANGLLAVRMRSGHSVRLDSGTSLRVISDRIIALDRGAVYVDSRGPLGSAGIPLEIRTPRGTARDIGTQFELRLDLSLRIRVREGRVWFDDRGDRVELAAGDELEAGDSGRTLRHGLDPFDAGWNWIGEITPMLELEGRSAREFVEWAARERGLRPSFTTLELAEASAGIELNGSIQGMTLEESLESVLPTCGLSHRVEGELLVIEARER